MQGPEGMYHSGRGAARAPDGEGFRLRGGWRATPASQPPSCHASCEARAAPGRKLGNPLIRDATLRYPTV